MPANLTPQYLEAEQRFRAATTPEDREEALEEMIATLPKHKGTEKIYADLKTRLAKLKKEREQTRKSGPARRGPEYVIESEGAGQVVVLGAPNTGKSALIGALTNAEMEVTDYPFATRRPAPGMMRYEDVPVQLVDTPSIAPDFLDQFLMPFVRTADAAVICVDPSSPDCLDQAGWVTDALGNARIEVVRGTVSAMRRGTSPRVMPGFIAATKADHPDTETAMELLGEVIGDRLDIHMVTIEDGASLDRFRRRVFDLLGLVRVYSKAPGKDADMMMPYLLPIGATVLDFAERVHRDFRERFAFARVWGSGPSHEGQRVPRNYLVQDRDVVELHAA